MNAWNLVDMFNAISVFFLCFFSLFLFTHRRGKRSSNRVLGLFLLAMALSLLNFLLSREHRLPASFLPAFLFGNSFDFLLGPLLFLYVKSVAYQDFSWRKGYILHAIPLASYILFLAGILIATPSALSSLMAFKKSHLSSSGMRFFVSLISVLLISYIGTSFRVLSSYRARIRNSFSSLEKINLSWLNLIIGGFGLIWLIGVINHLQSTGRGSGKPSLALSLINILITFGMANIIIFRGLRQPEIFSGIEEKIKYEKSPLTEKDAERLLARLRDYIEKEKSYLVPGLSISALAREMSVPSRYLSQVINSKLHQNFLDFVNTYRIKEAKRLLSTSGQNGQTILEIGFEVGFNSKSVFNRAFKKHAGMPPREFRSLVLFSGR